MPTIETRFFSGLDQGKYDKMTMFNHNQNKLNNKILINVRVYANICCCNLPQKRNQISSVQHYLCIDNMHAIHKGVGYEDRDIAVLRTPKATYQEMRWHKKCDIEYINSNFTTHG